MPRIEEKVESIIEKTISDLGYNLYDVEYVKEGKDYYLRVFIEKDSGVSLDDCETVSNAINELLDSQEYLREQYFLEVSSTGIEKSLRKDKHFDDNVGNEIEIKLYKPINKRKSIIGILDSYNENEIIVKNENDELEIIERKDIASVKTVYHWN